MGHLTTTLAPKLITLFFNLLRQNAVQRISLLVLTMLRSTKCLPLTAFRRNPSSFHNDNPESTEDVIKDVLEKAFTCNKEAQYVPYIFCAVLVIWPAWEFTISNDISFVELATVCHEIRLFLLELCGTGTKTEIARGCEQTLAHKQTL